MDVGIHYIDFLPGDPAKLAPTLLATATAAEDIGASVFTLADHFFQMENVGRARGSVPGGLHVAGLSGGPDHQHHSDVAGHRGHLSPSGTAGQDGDDAGCALAGPVDVRHRAAWYEREHLALGIPYPPVRERFEMLEETLQICLQMWSDNDGPYDGKALPVGRDDLRASAYSAAAILIGGGGEKKTLRMVAQYADVWNSTRRRVGRGRAQARCAATSLRHRGP